MKIAIVGIGLSGSVVLRSILEHKNLSKDDKIYLFEPRAKLGTGMPYEDDSAEKKLNTRANYVSVHEDNPLDFMHWLQDNVDHSYNLHEGMPSRKDYGRYVHERFTPYYNHEQVVTVRSHVEDVNILHTHLNDERNHGLYSYQLKADGEWLEQVFSAVFFCIGHPNYQDFYKLKQEEGYIHNPYPLREKLVGLKTSDKVAVIGAGSTGVDVFRYLKKHYTFETPVHFLVRESAFKISEIFLQEDAYPFSMSHTWIEETSHRNHGLIPLQEILNLIAEDFQAANRDFHTIHNRIRNVDLMTQKQITDVEDQDIAYIQGYLSKLSRYFAELYGKLSAFDREEFLKTYDKILDFYLGPTPFETTLAILEAYEEGHLALLYNIESIETRDGEFMAQGDFNMTFDKIINATGFDFNLKSGTEDFSLIKNLYEKNIILPDQAGEYILVDWPSLNLLNKRYGKMCNALLMGLWISGTHYRNNDIPSILRVGRKASNLFMDEVYPLLLASENKKSQ